MASSAVVASSSVASSAIRCCARLGSRRARQIRSACGVVRSLHVSCARRASNDWRGIPTSLSQHSSPLSVAPVSTSAGVAMTPQAYAGSALSGTSAMPVFVGFASSTADASVDVHSLLFGDDDGSVAAEDALLSAVSPATVTVDVVGGSSSSSSATDSVSSPAGSSTSDEAMYADSTLRKRRAKMNKHKRRKWRRKMRDLGGKNLKQKK